MAEFTYNNIKNANIGHTLFELNYGYHSYVFFDNDANPCSKSCLVEELAKKLRNLMSNCQQNLLYNQKLQKQKNDKRVKLQSYTFSEKVWLNSKYIKIQ